MNGSGGAVWQNGSDMEVHVEQKGSTKFLHEETMEPIDIHQLLFMLMETKK